MKTEDIIKIIDDFVNASKSNERAILIDGKWGCGKTYSINKVLSKYSKKKKSQNNVNEDSITQDTITSDVPQEKVDSNDKNPIKNKNHPKVYYASLFGVENARDISAKVNELFKPRRQKPLKKAMEFGSALVNDIPGIKYVKNITDSITLLLDDNERKYENIKIEDNVTIIFDDVERAADNLSFKSFHGFINTLLLSGIKVVCVCCTDEIGDVNRQKEDFNNFKEKMFDRVYEINESPDEIITEMFKDIDGFDVNETHINELSSYFDSNIRIAKKTKNLLLKVFEVFKNENIDWATKATELLILSSCLFAMKIVLENDVGEEKTEDNSDPASHSARAYTLYDIQTENIRNLPISQKDKAINFFFKNKDKIPTSLSETADLTGALIHLSLFNDKQYLVKYFKTPATECENDSISTMPFISHDHNLDFSQNYIKCVKSKQIKLDTENTILEFCQFMDYTDYDYSNDDDFVNAIVDNIANEVSDEHVFSRVQLMINEYSVDEEIRSLLSDILRQAKEKYLSLTCDKECQKLGGYFENKDYTHLDLEINEYFLNPNIDDDSKAKILIVIKDKYNYFLPDDIGIEFTDWSQWSCLLSTARQFQRNKDLSEEYVKHLMSIGDKCKDLTVTRRIKTLIESATMSR